MDTFVQQCGERTVFFRILRLQDSVFLWAGLEGAPPELASLTAAMPPRFEELGSAATVLGEAQTDREISIARMLSARLKQACYCSVQLPDEAQLDALVVRAVASRLAASAGM